jgi:type IV pilus assembly protein PilC
VLYKDLSNGKAELPFVTKLLLSISHNIVPVSIVTILIIALLVIMHIRAKTFDGYKIKIDELKLKVPVFGKFLNKIALTYFTQGFSALLASGTPLPDALEISKGIANNAYIEKAIDDVRAKVIAGSALQDALAERVEVFTPMMVGMVKAGQESGSTVTMLEVVSRFYKKEVDRTADALGQMIEPILTLFIGIIVGFIALAMLLPVYFAGGLLGG